MYIEEEMFQKEDEVKMKITCSKIINEFSFG